MAERDGSFQLNDLSGIDLGELDPANYDFDELQADIETILDTGSAVRSVLKWTFLVPIVGGFIAWLVFRSRMGSVGLFLFIVVLMGLLAFTATSIGVFRTLRQRIAQTDAAASRVITTTSLVHADVLQAQSGDIDLPMREVAGMLTSEVVFPALTAGGTSLVSSSGPLGWAATKLMNGPLELIQQRVLRAIDGDDGSAEGGAAAQTLAPGADDTNQDSAPDDATSTEPHDNLVGDLELGAIAGNLPTDVSDWYRTIQEGLARVVGGVGTVATGSLGAIFAFSLLPLVGWLALGWFAF
ncbi:MAG: hypothetical protein AAF567_19955 [Actinomycetota bacterium]